MYTLFTLEFYKDYTKNISTYVCATYNAHFWSPVRNTWTTSN